MKPPESWRRRLRTVQAMLRLCKARLLVTWVPFARWRTSLGRTDETRPDVRPDEVRRLVAHVQRAASLLPFPTTCLVRAMALSWMLRDSAIAHSTVIAVRPPGVEPAADKLHAWVEVEGTTVIGELPGPWVEMLRLGP